MPPLQERYYELLMERVSNDRHPSHQLLDRIEASIWTAEQVINYVDMLIDKCDESWYPSHQMMARIERMLQLTAATT